MNNLNFSAATNKDGGPGNGYRSRAWPGYGPCTYRHAAMSSRSATCRLVRLLAISSVAITFGDRFLVAETY